MPQQGALAAPGFAAKHHEFWTPDGETHILQYIFFASWISEVHMAAWDNFHSCIPLISSTMGMDINPNKIFDFVNQVPHTDQYTFNPKELASSLGYGRYKGSNNGAKYVSYRVRKGDSLSRIANKYGVSISHLCKLNGIKRNGVLREGKILRIK